MLYGTAPSSTGLTTIVSATLTAGNLTNATYTELAGNFTVPTTGTYFIALKAIGSFNPWYLTFDDLSIVDLSPTISVSAPALTAFTSCAGSVSTEQSYTVAATNLTANISIVPPTGFEISTGTGGGFVATSPIILTQTGGNIATTTIYVRQSAAAANGSSGNITHTSTEYR